MSHKAIATRLCYLCLILVAFATFIEAHRNHGHGKGKHDHDDDHDHHHHSHGNNKADVAISRASLEEDECAASSLEDYDVPLHVASIFIVVIVSLIGSFTPLIGIYFPQFKIPSNWIRMGQLFGCGTILATAFIHMLIPAVSNLTSPCLSEDWTSYSSLAGVFAMASILLMQLGQYLIISYYESVLIREMAQNEIDLGGLPPNKESSSTPQQERNSDTITSDVYPTKSQDNTNNNHHDHHHHHGGLVISKVHQRRLTTYLLELGIAMHSVVIGVSLGVTSGPEFIPLLIAICFHQLCEGLALGSTVAQSVFQNKFLIFLLSAVYGVTTPLGVAIGMGIRNSYNANSASSLLVEGIFDSVSAGILIYTALVEILTPEITMNSEFRQQSLGSKISQFFALYFGAAIMAIIGIWA